VRRAPETSLDPCRLRSGSVEKSLDVLEEGAKAEEKERNQSLERAYIVGIKSVDRFQNSQTLVL